MNMSNVTTAVTLTPTTSSSTIGTKMTTTTSASSPLIFLLKQLSTNVTTSTLKTSLKDTSTFLCPSDRWGKRCEHICKPCGLGVCHPATGNCICPADIYGEFCDLWKGNVHHHLPISTDECFCFIRFSWWQTQTRRYDDLNLFLYMCVCVFSMDVCTHKYLRILLTKSLYWRMSGAWKTKRTTFLEDTTDARHKNTTYGRKVSSNRLVLNCLKEWFDPPTFHCLFRVYYMFSLSLSIQRHATVKENDWLTTDYSFFAILRIGLDTPINK